MLGNTNDLLHQLFQQAEQKVHNMIKSGSCQPRYDAVSSSSSIHESPKVLHIKWSAHFFVPPLNDLTHMELKAVDKGKRTLPKIDATVFRKAQQLCDEGKTKDGVYLFCENHWSTKQLIYRLYLWLARLKLAPLILLRPGSHYTKFFTLVCLLTFDPHNYLSWSAGPTDIDKFDHRRLFKWVWDQKLSTQIVLLQRKFAFVGDCWNHYQAFRAAYRRKNKLEAKHKGSKASADLTAEYDRLDDEMKKAIDLITTDCRKTIMGAYEQTDPSLLVLHVELRNQLEPLVEEGGSGDRSPQRQPQVAFQAHLPLRELRVTESPSPPRKRWPVRPAPELVPQQQELSSENRLFEQATLRLDDGGSSLLSGSALTRADFDPLEAEPDQTPYAIILTASLERLRAEALAENPGLPPHHPDSLYNWRVLEMEEEVYDRYWDEVPEGWQFSRGALREYRETIEMLLRGTRSEVPFSRRLKAAQLEYVKTYRLDQAIVDTHHAVLKERKRRLVEGPRYDLQTPESDFVSGRVTEEARRADVLRDRAAAIS